MHNIDKASGFSFDWLVRTQNSILSVILLAVPACVSSVFWGRKVGGRWDNDVQHSYYYYIDLNIVLPAGGGAVLTQF